MKGMVQHTTYQHQGYMIETNTGKIRYITWCYNEVERFKEHGIRAEIRYDTGYRVAIWKDRPIQ